MNASDGLIQVHTLATDTVLSAWAWGTDFLIVIILFSTFFLFAWYRGRGPFIGLILAFYAAYGAYTVFPYGAYLPSAPALTALVSAIAVYSALTLIAYLILRRVVVSDFVYIGLFGLILLAFLSAGFALALAYHVFPVQDVYTFTPAVNALFAAKQWFFWWFIAPLLGLFFLAR